MSDASIYPFEGMVDYTPDPHRKAGYGKLNESAGVSSSARHSATIIHAYRSTL